MEEDRSRPAVKAQPKNQEQEARDSVIFGDEATEERQFEPSVTVTSNVVDPITQAIRDEVITRQQLYLQQEVAKVVDGAERMEILDQNLPEFRSFVESERGKDVLEEVAAKPQVQKQLHSMETAGYKAVHSQFSDRFHDVEWQAPSAGKVRSTNITNSQGEAVCNLSETTFDTVPQNVVLSNGTARVIRSYRQIDFPKELETGKGPVHLSMAVKDENGKNIAEKDAVYFTAHYNESGKLEEVSTPVPVKFMGKGDDAIGYIERDGKVFTLPVTQGKYYEMMQEVAKNKGMNADLSQSVEMEKLAVDIVVTNAKDVPSKLARKAATIGKDVDASKVDSVGHTSTPAIQRKADHKGHSI